MSSAGSAPVRQPEPEVPVVGVPGILEAPEDPGAARRRIVAKLRLLWEHRRLLSRVATYAFLASMLIAFLIPERYEATTQLMPPDAESGTGMAMLTALNARGGPGLSGLAGNLLGVKSSGALFVGVLQSRTVADRLIEQFQLQRLYHESKMEDARKELAHWTNIAEDRKSGILTISVTDHNAQRAAAMARAYITELDRLVAEVSTSSARRERIFLEERLHDVKQDLDATAQRFSEFASKNTAIDIPAQSKAMVEAAAALQGQLIAAGSELRGLEQIYTNQNVRVRALRARVAELRQQLRKLGAGDASAGASGDAQLYPSIRRLPVLGMTYADLYRQTKIQETVYELLTQQCELAKVQEAKEIPAVKVLDAAVAPTKKSFPPRTLTVFLGTTLALGVAVAWISAKARWEALDRDDPGKVFAQEVFATVKARLPLLSKNGAEPSAAQCESTPGTGEGENEQQKADL